MRQVYALALFLSVAAACATMCAAADAASPPNIVFILADDLGYRACARWGGAIPFALSGRRSRRVGSRFGRERPARSGVAFARGGHCRADRVSERRLYAAPVGTAHATTRTTL